MQNMKTAGPNPKWQNYVDAIIGMSAKSGHKKYQAILFFSTKFRRKKNFVIGCKILGMTTGAND